MTLDRFPLFEAVAAILLLVAPWVLPVLGFAPDTVNHVLIWGLFGIGFDLLFGYTGLLSFGQAAFFGTGGFVAAYLLTVAGWTDVFLALLIGIIAAAAVGVLVGLVALRRTGIYFAMITVAIAEMFFFLENNPLAHWTGGENGLPGVPAPSISLFGWHWQVGVGWSMYNFLAVCYFLGLVLGRRIVRSPVGAILVAIRDNPQRVLAVGHNVQLYKLTAFVIAAAYAGFAGGLLGVLQGFMPPEAFIFDTSGQLVVQTVIGGPGTLIGPLVGAGVWLSLRDFLQSGLHLGSAWKLVLGLVFVLLVIFLRHGIIGGVKDLFTRSRKAPAEAPAEAAPLDLSGSAAGLAPRRAEGGHQGPAIEARGLTKAFGGLVANRDIHFSVPQGELRGVIGPNGAGKSTFFKMLTCEMAPSAGQILFQGQDITGRDVSSVCQMGLTKSYQINQLFVRLTARQNVEIATLAHLRGRFALDMLRPVASVPGLSAQVEATLAMVGLTARAETPVGELAYGEKRRLEIALALASSPSLLLLDEPLAGMSPQERKDTVSLLKTIREGRTLIVIDHDMDAMFDLADRITVLAEGQVLAEGTPAEIKDDRTVRDAYLGGEHM